MKQTPILIDAKLDWLKDFRGHTYSQRLVSQAFLYLVEEKKRAFAKIRGRNPSPETCLVTVQDRFREIMDIGGSMPSDLVLNNFGTWLAGVMRTPINAATSVTLVDSAGANQTVSTYAIVAGANVFNRTDVGAAKFGTQMKIGSSATAPARNNVDIGTAFGTAPESSLFDTGTGSYAAGSITVSGSITAGGAGTIRETGFYGIWNIASAAGTFMLFHDSVSATGFAAGQNITVQYAVSL